MDPLDFKPMDGEERERILEFIRGSLSQADPDRLRRAVLSLDWVESGPHLSAPLMQLVQHGSPELAQIALDGLARLEAFEVEAELLVLVDNLTGRSGTEPNTLRLEVMRTLGKLGREKSVEKLAAVVLDPAPERAEDRLAAVEGLVSLGVREIPAVAAVLERLHGQVGEADLKLCLANALRELNVTNWDDKGYLTIEARYEIDPEPE